MGSIGHCGRWFSKNNHLQLSYFSVWMLLLPPGGEVLTFESGLALGLALTNRLQPKWYGFLSWGHKRIGSSPSASLGALVPYCRQVQARLYNGVRDPRGQGHTLIIPAQGEPPVEYSHMNGFSCATEFHRWDQPAHKIGNNNKSLAYTWVLGWFLMQW